MALKQWTSIPLPLLGGRPLYKPPYGRRLGSRGPNLRAYDGEYVITCCADGAALVASMNGISGRTRLAAPCGSGMDGTAEAATAAAAAAAATSSGLAAWFEGDPAATAEAA